MSNKFNSPADLSSFMSQLKEYARDNSLTRISHHLIDAPESFGIPPTDDYGRIHLALQKFTSRDLRVLPKDMADALVHWRDAMDKAPGSSQNFDALYQL